MDRPIADRGLSEGRTILLMAVAAVLLATVVVATATGGGGDDAVDPPHASFVFEPNGTSVNVTHYGGDRLDGASVYLESGDRGPLGNVAGTDGAACAANLTRIGPGDSCLIANATAETLYVVWRSDGDRYILERRSGDPTPAPTADPTPAVSETPTDIPPGTGPTTTDPTPTATTADGTGTPPENGTRTDRPPTGEPTTDGPGTPGETETVAGTPSPTPGTPTESDPGATATEGAPTETESPSA